MSDERFAEHLTHPRNRGHEPVRGHSGVAGGGACGDLVHLRVAVDADRVSDAGFEASGCGATIAAASAVVELVTGAPVLEAARVNSATIAAELGGLSVGKLHAADLAADALHRALGAAARADARLEAKPDRTLVAMSGGVDSAVAALTAEGEAVAVTLELWRDPDNDGEGSCCSADAVRQARALAHRMGLAHFTLDLRDEFRAGVVAPWLAAHGDGLTPNPRVGCTGHLRPRLQRPRPTRRDARLRRPPRRRPPDDRALRAPHGGRSAAPGEGPRQGPELHARRAEPPDAAPPPLPARRDREQGGGARDRARARSPGGEQGRLPGPLLPRRHGPRPLPRQARRAARAPRRHRRPRRPPARTPPRPSPLHRRPAPGA